MNRLAEILKRHIWCVITIAAIVLLALITLSFSEDVNLVSHLSLTSAVVSIVLAIIVIVYMYFQDQRSSQNITEMRRLIDEGYRTMTDQASLVAEKAQSIDQQMATMTRPSPIDSEPATPPVEIKESLQFEVSFYSKAGLLLLYSLVKFCKSGKAILWSDISDLIYKDNKEWAYQVRMHGFGIVQCLESFLGHEYLSSSLVGEQIRVKKLPNGLAESVITELDRRIKNEDDDFSKNGMVAIDKYFDNL